MPKKATLSADPSATPSTPPHPRRDPVLSPDENLQEILRAAAESRLQERLAALPPPRTEALIQLHRALAFQLLSQPDPDVETLKRVNLLMRPVLGWVALVEKRKLRELSERKYQDHVETEKERERKKHLPEEERALSPETFEWVERQLDLFLRRRSVAVPATATFERNEVCELVGSGCRSSDAARRAPSGKAVLKHTLSKRYLDLPRGGSHMPHAPILKIRRSESRLILECARFTAAFRGPVVF